MKTKSRPVQETDKAVAITATNPSHNVSITLNHPSYLVLAAMAKNDGFGSVEECVLHDVADSIAGWIEDMHRNDVRVLLGLPQEKVVK